MFAHEAAGRGNVSINAVKLNTRVLTFQNPFYESRYIDVLTYGVKNETDYTTDWWDLVVGPLNYMTQGLRPDCVCYLTLLSSLKMEFSLYQHVCGINVTGITDVPLKKKNKPAATTTAKPTKVTKKLSAITARKSTKVTKKLSVTTAIELDKSTKKPSRKTTKKSTTAKISTEAKKSTEQLTRKTRRKCISDTWS